jgi:hypothetical protein
MLPRVVTVLMCLFCFTVSDSPVWARSPRAQRASQTAAPAPPFPWIAVLETVGPILGIWLGTVLLRRTREKKEPGPAPSEIASLPVAWFTAMSGLFERRQRQLKTAPPQEAWAPESQSLTSDH